MKFRTRPILNSILASSDCVDSPNLRLDLPVKRQNQQKKLRHIRAKRARVATCARRRAQLSLNSLSNNHSKGYDPWVKN